MSDEEIEKAMLFYVIFQGEQYDLSEEDFEKVAHKKIINAVNQLKLEKNEVSMLTVANKLQVPNALKYLSYLGDYTYKSSASKIYEILKGYTKKRQILEISKNIQKEILNEDNIDVFIEKNIQALQKVEQQTEKDESFVSQVVTTAEIIEKSINRKEDYSLYTGYIDLDALTDGLHNGEFTVVGARPGVGKTTFSLGLAENIAKKGKEVTYVSLEMSETQIIQKLLAMRTGINSRKIRNGNLEQKEVEKLGFECMTLGNLKFNILTKTSTIQQIEIQARRMKNKGKLDLLIIDYLQLVRNMGSFRSREQEVADISRTLKLLSLELDIPVIALCQLNRNASKAEPTLADIRESGSIEQDADNVIFLYQENQESDLVTVDLQKQRSGNIGKLELKFHKNTSRFVGIER